MSGLPNKVICRAATLPSLAHSFRAHKVLEEYLQQPLHCSDVILRPKRVGLAQVSRGVSGRAGSGTPGCSETNESSSRASSFKLPAWSAKEPEYSFPGPYLQDSNLVGLSQEPRNLNFKSPPPPSGDSVNDTSLGNTREWEGHMSRGQITKDAHGSFHKASP